MAVRRAASLPPAEAMRPEPPGSFRPTFAERIGLQQLIPPATRMILRNLERQPVKTGASIVGIAMAVGVLVLGSFGEDSLEYLIDQQFKIARRQDMTVAFVEPATSSILHDIENLPGVIRAEPIRGIGTRMRFEHRSRRVGIIGLPPDMELFQLLDASRKRIGAGPAHIIESAADLEEFRAGEVLVTDKTDPDWEPTMKKAAAIVTNRGGRTCHAAIVSRELGLPAIVGTINGTEILRDDQHVTVSLPKCRGTD